MISPDQTTRARDLCYEVRSLENLWGAWHSVRRRALASSDEAIQRDARDFDQNPSKHIRAIHEALRRGEYRFAPQRGVLKPRKDKDPRPIVISPVRNRLVQRAILDVLQSDRPRISRRLGDVPKVLATPTSVGGIPGRGSPEAVALIRSYIADGATHFIRSDIKDFFTKVPTPKVLAYLCEQTNDEAFVRFIQDALDVELSNAEEPRVRKWMSLFPTADLGVPQGSSLSALCANVVLRDFDAALNQRGVHMIRYIDDFVMLSKNERSLRLAWKSAESMLKDLGLEAHQPATGSPKASSGLVCDGFEFLSFRFHGNKVSPSRSAKQDLLAVVNNEIREVRKAIQSAGTAPRRAEPRLIQALNTIDRRVRGWGDAFKDVDQRLEFAQIDNQIHEAVDKLIRWHFTGSKSAPPASWMRKLGIATLADTPPSSRQQSK